MSSPGADGHRPHNPSPSPSVSEPDPGGTTPKPLVVDREDPRADQEHLLYAFGQLSVCKELPMAERMFLLLEDIFQRALEKHRIVIDVPDWHNRLRGAHNNNQRGIRDIEVLRWIQPVLNQMQVSAPEEFAQAANVLADGSRDERAQHAFRTNGLLPALLNLLVDPDFESGPLFPYLCSLFNFSTQQVDLTGCPDHALQTITRLLEHPEAKPDDMLQILNAIGSFLQQERCRRQFVDENLVTVLLDTLVDSYKFDASDPDTEEEISLLRNAVNQLLSDISATNLFAESYTIESPIIGSLIQWLSSRHEQLRISSCLVLGNLARSDSICLHMVSRLALHEKLLELLHDQSNMQDAYAALGFLRNLALPTENKEIIGTQQSVETISTFWSQDLHPQVQHASVSLLRQLMNKCIGNVRWLLESLSPDQDSPAHEKTYMSLLLLLFGRTDDVSTKVEIGRTVATICRCIASSSQGLPAGSTSAILHRLYGMHADIARPLAMMVSQSRFPIIRSEGWFALALMARSREGSAAVSEALQQMEVFGALVTTITGQPTNGQAFERGDTSNTRLSGSSTGSETRSEQEVEMQAKDRENALVLVSEMLKNTVRIDFLFVDTLHRILAH
ncbi:MAG: hypothetical protein Q9219_001623 [cf. Caloplaca sp. 3 TL-2023]